VVPSAEQIAYVPAENLHVPRAEFAAVWTAAEALAEEGARNGTSNWYVTGVVITCRWVALAIVRPPDGGPGYVAFAPVTQTKRMAYPELIERECLRAGVQAIRPPAWLLDARPGWVEAVDATFAWCWRKTGPPPVPVERTASGPAIA